MLYAEMRKDFFGVSQLSCLSSSKLAFSRESLLNGFRPRQEDIGRDSFGQNTMELDPSIPSSGRCSLIRQSTQRLECVGIKESSRAQYEHLEPRPDDNSQVLPRCGVS